MNSSDQSSVLDMESSYGIDRTSPASVPLEATAKPAWVQVVSHLDPKYGGLSAAVPNLSRAVADAGERSVSVTGFCLPNENYVPMGHSNVHFEHFPSSRLEWLKHRSHGTRFRRTISRAAGLHIHGLWQQSSAVTGQLARHSGLPYVVSAHGMLESWAMANKRWKKALYMSIVEGSNLRGAACLHALTRAEAEDYRRLELSNPVAVIPNGVIVPPNPSPSLFLDEFPALRGKQILLFLGRVHFKKGLDLLCRAWEGMKRPSDAHLVIAGPDFENTRARIEELIDNLNIRNSVTFTGMLGGALKWGALAASHAFVLPSYSEGLSVSVLEAMGAARPVIITEHCNLPEVARNDCGWVIPAQIDALQAAISEALHSSASKLQSLGANGQRLVEERFSWKVIGEQMNNLYRWLEGGSVPADIDLQFAKAAAQ